LRLGCARADWILIMITADKTERVVCTIVCLVAFVPVAIAGLAHIMRLEARRGYLICQSAIGRVLRR
jgi:hypothetical protein